ncbi:hypothetical protein SEA_PHAYETA_67 [Mycobacterium phage Phayeta]|nr:hypothetical protein SEA_PHAYETA_67 [Mycobacterium phage Phayeta]
MTLVHQPCQCCPRSRDRPGGTEIEMSQSKRCPLCGNDMNPVETRNALSRYVPEYICSPCGQKEALGLHVVSAERGVALYRDDLIGIVAACRVGGYLELWPAPYGDAEWQRKYVAAVNERAGIPEDRALSIVAASMSGGVR